jgi:hypothetical protein
VEELTQVADGSYFGANWEKQSGLCIGFARKLGGGEIDLILLNKYNTRAAISLKGILGKNKSNCQKKINIQNLENKQNYEEWSIIMKYQELNDTKKPE